MIGAGGSEALARQRAEAVAETLRASGLQASVSLDDPASVRARARDNGPQAARTVRVEIGEVL